MIGVGVLRICWATRFFCSWDISVFSWITASNNFLNASWVYPAVPENTTALEYLTG